MEPLIKIENVTVGYNREPVLKNVNLTISEQDFLGIIGPNGGGKTTLLKTILGLLKPFSGSINFRKDFAGEKKPIGYLPQVKYIDQKFPITVYEVVRSGAIMQQNLPGKTKLKERVMALLKEMGIYDLKDKAIGELSGGQMQRVFLCRAVISNPKVLILDEPDTFVDNRFEGELYEKLKQLNESIAIMLVSHDIGTISSYVKTIACVNGNLHYHASNTISQEQLNSYNCPIQIITHGEIPHTVLKRHH
jgi:zinc transport system ATP-binding protein